MAHPILSRAVERALAAFDQMEAAAGPLQSQAMIRLWAEIDAVRRDLMSTLEAVEAIQSEQARLRAHDEAVIAAAGGLGRADAGDLCQTLLRDIGLRAFSEDGLCRLAMLFDQADAKAAS